MWSQRNENWNILLFEKIISLNWMLNEYPGHSLAKLILENYNNKLTYSHLHVFSLTCTSLKFDSSCLFLGSIIPQFRHNYPFTQVW
jgi:hypothetical protein